MPEQLPLAVNLPDDETFSSFINGDNQQVIAQLRASIAPDDMAESNATSIGSTLLTFISGESGTGKSHLLYAACHLAASEGVSHIYLDLNECGRYDTSILDGLESIQLICLDNVEQLQANHDWQVALFDLINRVKENEQSHLVLTANAGPAALTLELPDLRSRLAWGVSFAIHPLDDQQRCRALMVRAEQRGMHMPIEVSRFLLNHTQRDMPGLMSILQTLDESSLKAQRKLTIPFVKQVLDI